MGLRNEDHAGSASTGAGNAMTEETKRQETSKERTPNHVCAHCGWRLLRVLVTDSNWAGLECHNPECIAVENRRLRSALRKLDNGFKYSTEVCTIAREALAGPAPETNARPRCKDCGNEMDPDWCWCGDAMADHKGMSHNHSPVPMGCSCGMRLPPRAELKASAPPPTPWPGASPNKRNDPPGSYRDATGELVLPLAKASAVHPKCPMLWDGSPCIREAGHSGACSVNGGASQ